MLIEFTQEEQQHFKEIQDSFTPEWERLTALINAASDKDEERRSLLIQRQAVYDSMIEEIDAYNEDCQRKRFNEKFNEFTPVNVLIEDAKQQAPTILEYIHRETVRDFEGVQTEELEAIGVGTVKKGKLYVYAEYATKWLKDELRLHIEAVKADKDNLQTLLAALIEAVEVSPYTCGADTTRTKAGKTEPQALEFKHKPLSITPDSAIFKANMPMYHGKATDALAALSHRDVTENPIADKAVIQTASGDYKIVIQDFSKVKGKLSKTLGSNTVLYLQGKGRDERTEYIKVVPAVEKTLREYLKTRQNAKGQQPLFSSLSNNSRGERLSSKSISSIVKDRLIQAGYNSDRLTAHSLRHSAVTISLIGGLPLEEVQQFARHKNISTTQIYAHNLERAKNRSEDTIAASIFKEGGETWK